MTLQRNRDGATLNAMRRFCSVLALVICLTACADDESEDRPAVPSANSATTSEPAPTPEATTTAPAATVGLDEVCPQVRDAVPDDFTSPDAAFLGEFGDLLKTLATSANDEARPLVEVLQDRTSEAEAALSSDAVLPELEASKAFDAGLSELNEQCP